MSSGTSKDRKLLVLFIDGFRWDYFDVHGLELPGFQMLFDTGVKADYMQPEFPSLTFPNFHSIMSGLHVEDHGLVGNYIYDKERKSSFEYKMLDEESNRSYWFEGAEPMYITATKQGKRTYMFEWPSCHISYDGVLPTFYDTMTTWPVVSQLRANLQTALTMFKNDKIDMAGVYLHANDKYGHSYGPNSKQVSDSVAQTDAAIKEMLEAIYAESLEEKINIIIFSDHGMTEISEARTVDISDHIGDDDVDAVVDKGPTCGIWPKDGKTQKVYSGINGMKNNNIKVYKKADLPERWRYKNHRLVAPITVVANSGWYILTPQNREIETLLDGPAKGYHGYNNTDRDMRGIFLAAGPDFKKNYKAGPVKAVDIYQVMCKALDIKPLQHRGTWSTVKDMFCSVK